MCGIVGYVGKNKAVPILLYGLNKLEYRGYDSAGVAVCVDQKLKVVKSKGQLGVLKSIINDGCEIQGYTGLGHTRWATHGLPSDANSHPHTSGSGKLAVVHNGIIENYAILKKLLIEKGVKFVSETDTEVIAHLIEYYNKENLLEAVLKAVSKIKGSYALGIISSDYPDCIIAVRKDSPLIVGHLRDNYFMASDVSAIAKFTREVTYLKDGDIAVLTPEGATFYNVALDIVQRERVTIDWDITAVEKGEYEHFMLKEIMEQPKVLYDTISPSIKDGEVFFEGLTEEKYKNISKIFITACGSAYHVGVGAKYFIEKTVRIPVEAIVASEFRYSNPIVDENTLVVVISQSGETADTLAALREAKRRQAMTLAIINVKGSTIAKEADDVIFTQAGPEIAVATTKAYSSQLAVMTLFTLYLARHLGTIGTEEYKGILDEFMRMPDRITKMLDKRECMEAYAKQYYNKTDVFFIGRNFDYALCLEGSLKLKEISYIHSEAYPAGELKHGSISLVEKGTLVIAVGVYDKLFDKLLSNIIEVKARGAEIFALTVENSGEEIFKVADNCIFIPETHELLRPLLAIIPLQLFSYYVALMRGCDIDKPRNLAKSVTVE